MLLTITSTAPPATDLGFLLHKHPSRLQTFPLSFGQAHVFYPEATTVRCTAALLLDVDPVGLARRRGRAGGSESDDGHYVNDRPYVASSFMSVAISEVFGSALAGRSRERADLVDAALPLQARLSVLPSRGGEDTIRRLFEPLGYAVSAQAIELDAAFPDWSASSYFTVQLQAACRLRDLLSQLCVLVPVLDDRKHYFVSDDEVAKLLRRGQGWLSSHPERRFIAMRYLRHRRGLVRDALERLEVEEGEADGPDDVVDEGADLDVERVLGLSGESAGASTTPAIPAAGSGQEAAPEAGAGDDPDRPISLGAQRIAAVLAVLKQHGARSVIDLGCGEGNLLRALLADRQFERIVGLDVSYRSLERARARLRLDRLPPRQAERITLLHGALTYRDNRLAGFEAAAVVEVVEHLDPPRLSAFERVLFEHARPGCIVLTTPNGDHNVRYEGIPAGALRHPDHRFEWTRAEFRAWAEGVASRFGYRVAISGVGAEDPDVGAPSQLAVFRR